MKLLLEQPFFGSNTAEASHAGFTKQWIQTPPKAQMTRNAEKHGIADVSALIEATQDNEFQCPIKEEEEKMAQDLILQPLVDEEEGGPLEAASKGKPENEIEFVGSAFLSLVTMAIKDTEENDHVDEKILDAQNLELHVAWAARAKPPDNISSLAVLHTHSTLIDFSMADDEPVGLYQHCEGVAYPRQRCAWCLGRAFRHRPRCSLSSRLHAMHISLEEHWKDGPNTAC